MKKALRVLGVILLVCGIGLYLIGGAGQKSTAPSKVQLGYISDGKMVVTDSGYLGGNKEGQKTMDSLKTAGVATMVGGAAALVISFVIKDDEYYE